MTTYTLESIKNQNGEKVPSKELYNAGQWYNTIVVCHNSEALGLGTCQCFSHRHTKIYFVSREEVKKQVKKFSIKLSKEDYENLYNPSLQCCIEEIFMKHRVTQEEMEKWCALSYKMGSNPLPFLREMLKGIKVAFMYGGSGSGYATNENTLVVVYYEGDEGDEDDEGYVEFLIKEREPNE